MSDSKLSEYEAQIDLALSGVKSEILNDLRILLSRNAEIPNLLEVCIKINLANSPN